MNNKLISSVIISSSILAYTALTPAAVLSSGNGSEVCQNPQIKSYKSDSESQMTYTDSNNIIDSVCIKSGSKMFNGNQHSSPLGNGTYENGCYEVSGVGSNTVTVKKLKDGNTCQGLSHLDIFTKQATEEQNNTESKKEDKVTIVEKVVEKIVEKRVEVIKEKEVIKQVEKPIEVLSSNTTQLADTGLGLNIIQKGLISAVLFILSFPLSLSLKKLFI